MPKLECQDSSLSQALFKVMCLLFCICNFAFVKKGLKLCKLQAPQNLGLLLTPMAGALSLKLPPSPRNFLFFALMLFMFSVLKCNICDHKFLGGRGSVLFIFISVINACLLNAWLILDILHHSPPFRYYYCYCY